MVTYLLIPSGLLLTIRLLSRNSIRSCGDNVKNLMVNMILYRMDKKSICRDCHLLQFECSNNSEIMKTKIDRQLDWLASCDEGSKQFS